MFGLPTPQVFCSVLNLDISSLACLQRQGDKIHLSSSGVRINRAKETSCAGISRRMFTIVTRDNCLMGAHASCLCIKTTHGPQI